MYRLRIFILGLAALLLPVHATAAVAMSVVEKADCCAEMTTAHEPAAVPHDDMHTNHEQAPCGDEPCNTCGDCHLASGLMIPPSLIDDDELPGASQHGVSPAPTELSFITKPLPRPPRAS